MVKDREAWHAAVHRVAKSRRILSDHKSNTQGEVCSGASTAVKDPSLSQDDP